MNKKFCYLPIASDFMRENEIDRILDKYSSLLTENGIIRCKNIIADNAKKSIFFIMSGGVENKVLELIAAQKGPFPHDPVILLAHTEDNSLPAALEILARLKQDRIRGRIFQLASETDHKTINKIFDFVSEQKHLKPLSGEKIGLIGAPSDWLVASSPATSLVEKHWGVEVDEINIKEFSQRYNQVRATDFQQYLEIFRNSATATIEPNGKEIENAVKVYLVLKSIVKDHNLDALSLRCFDLIKELKTTGCYALAQLNNEGICASCEGDIVSLLGMIWVKQITGQISWMANPAKIDIQQKELLLAHCTIAFNLIENYTIRSHFESGIGVGISGKLPQIPVTLLRIGGKRLNRIWCGEGKIIENTTSDKLCRTQVMIYMKETGDLKELLDDPLGNHLLLIRGNYRKLLLENWNNK